MNILVTLNSSYVKPLCVMLKSMMLSNPDERFDLYVAHSSLTESDFAKIKEHTDTNRVKIHRVLIDGEILKNAPVLKRISKETYYRLLLLDYLPLDVDRILYIDPDTVIINSLSPFYNLDFGGKLLAAAGHTHGLVELANRIRFRHKKSERYFNAGVILFNLQKMRKSVTTEDIFSYIRKNEKRLYLADQDVLNGMFGKQALIVDERLYNLDEKTVSRYKITNDIWIRKNTVIVHFNGKFKPWKENYKGVLAHYWFEYLETEQKKLYTKVG